MSCGIIDIGKVRWSRGGRGFESRQGVTALYYQLVDNPTTGGTKVLTTFVPGSNASSMVW